MFQKLYNINKVVTIDLETAGDRLGSAVESVFTVSFDESGEEPHMPPHYQ